jgi:hypothetical protein
MRSGRIVRTLASPAGYYACTVGSWLPGATRFVARCFRKPGPGEVSMFDFSLGGTSSPVRPAVPAGWNEVDLADGKIAFKTSQPGLYSINRMSFARLSNSGRLEPIVVPAEFSHARWSLQFLTPAGLILGNASPDGDSLDEVASWNPLTDQVRELFRKAGDGGPHGLWAGWRTTWP